MVNMVNITTAIHHSNISNILCIFVFELETSDFNMSCGLWEIDIEVSEWRFSLFLDILYNKLLIN